MRYSDLPTLIFITHKGTEITLCPPPPNVRHNFFWGIFCDKEGKSDGKPAPLDPSFPAAQFFASQISLLDYHENL